MKPPLLLLSSVVAGSEGHISDEQRGRILATLRMYAGAELDIEIREHRRKRTNPQNARHWALMTVGAKALWEDPSEKDTLHDELAHLYFGLPPCPKTGMRRRRRTPNTETKEFAEFHEWCIGKLIELGADLSDWESETQRIEAD